MSKIKNDDTQPSRPIKEPLNKRRINWGMLGWFGFVLVLLYIFSNPIGEFFLSISSRSNPNAANSLAIVAEPPTATATYTPTPTPTPTPIPPQVIIQQIQPMGQLVVVGMEVAEADIHIGIRDGMCSHGADYVAQGVIEAGIDFKALDESNVIYDPENQSYTLKLPAPGLTSCRVEYIRQYANSFSLCNPDWDTARILARHEAMSNFIDKVLEDGILEQAEDQSTLLLGSFVSSFTGKPVDVTYEKARARTKLPSSCKPYVPRGWSYSQSKGTWAQNN